MKNAVLYNETLEIAKAMRKCSGEPYSPILFETNSSKNLKKIINNHSEEFIEYIHKLGLNIQSRSQTTDFEYTSFTILTLRTRCFKVDFNDNSVKISALK